jgi:cellulose synthase/poly-beta-1,6-N-acetylglucosamine synthase-like glycosyltransferase
MFNFFLYLYLFTLILCFCSYVLYPTALWIAGKCFPMRVKKSDIQPTLSILIAAYNEAKHIEQKIENTMALRYPKDKVEILVGSDGSADDTAALVKKYGSKGVRLLEFQANRGKTAVQNDLVSHSEGEILVFTDAASFLRSDALERLVQSFADERVGCAAGRMEFVHVGSNITVQSQGLYWRYESRIRQLESNLGRLIGVDGPLYAVRRSCYVPLAGNMISDLMTPLMVLRQGRRTILEPEAIVYEDPTRKSGQELKTRRRITLRGLTSLFAHRELFNSPKRAGLALQIVLHKVLRWFVGPLVMANAFACVMLSGHWLFAAILILYSVFGAAALSGWIVDKCGGKNRLLMVPYYFTLVNLAATLGIIDFVMRKQAISWKPVRN